MSNFTCPKCGGDKVVTERRPNGTTICGKCGYTGTANEFVKAASSLVTSERIDASSIVCQPIIKTVCGFCQLDKAGLSERQLYSASKQEIALLNERREFCIHSIDGESEPYYFVFNFCPMCGQQLEAKAGEPT